ncbi:MAG: hypothetical protein ACR2PL_11775 [Dehalococcoidia bacterium]
MTARIIARRFAADRLPVSATMPAVSMEHDWVLEGIHRFAVLLSSGAPLSPQQIPSSATLADWTRQTKWAGMFAEGRILYERCGLDLERLPEDLAVDVEEDYQVCARPRPRSRVEGGTVAEGVIWAGFGCRSLDVSAVTSQ